MARRISVAQRAPIHCQVPSSWHRAHCRNHGPSRPVVARHRRRPPHRPRDRARAGARTASTSRVHYRRSRDEAEATRAPSCARSARGARRVRGRPGRRSRVPRAGAGGRRALRPARRGRQQRLDCSSTTTSQTFSYAAMERHWRANTAPPSLLAQRAARAPAGGAAAPAASSTCSTRSCGTRIPTTCRTRCRRRRCRRRRRCSRRRWRRRVRVCGVAPGVTLPSGPMSDDEFDARACA